MTPKERLGGHFFDPAVFVTIWRQPAAARRTSGPVIALAATMGRVLPTRPLKPTTRPVELSCYENQLERTRLVG